MLTLVIIHSYQIFTNSFPLPIRWSNKTSSGVCLLVCVMSWMWNYWQCEMIVIISINNWYLAHHSVLRLYCSFGVPTWAGRTHMYPWQERHFCLLLLSVTKGFTLVLRKGVGLLQPHIRFCQFFHENIREWLHILSPFHKNKLKFKDVV